MDKIKGGLADNLGPREIAKKHGVTVDHIMKQLKKGLKILMLHTNLVPRARLISLDHLYLDPNYYTKLIKMLSRPILLLKLRIKSVIKNILVLTALQNLRLVYDPDKRMSYETDPIPYQDMKRWFDPKFAEWKKNNPQGSISQYEKLPSEIDKKLRPMPDQAKKQRRLLLKSDRLFYANLRKKYNLNNLGLRNMKERINLMVSNFIKNLNVGRVAGYNGPALLKKLDLGRGTDFRSGGGSLFTKPVRDSDGDPITKSKGKMVLDVTITFGNADDMYAAEDDLADLYAGRPLLLYPLLEQAYIRQLIDLIFEAASKVLPSRNQLNGEGNSPLDRRSRTGLLRTAHSNRVDVAINWGLPLSAGSKGLMIYLGADSQLYYDLMLNYMVLLINEEVDLTPRVVEGLDLGYDVC